MDYAVDHARIVAAYSAARAKQSGPLALPAAEAEARDWQEIRLLLRAKIAHALGLADGREQALEARLVAVIGEDWYREVRVEEVARLIEGAAPGRPGPVT